MWTRALLKTNAKRALKGRYWGAFAVCLILGLLGVTSTSTVSGSGAKTVESAVTEGQPLDELSAFILGAALVLVLVIAAAVLLWNLFVVNPLTVGRARYFIQNREKAPGSQAVTSVFHDGYMSIVKAQFLTNLKICVGFILLVVPGIYWAYCYTLVPYLLADDPHLTASEAMQKSRSLMDGEKWNYFVLELSFIGWDILCAFTFGVGGFFLEPYKQATYAEFYAAVSAKGAAR